MSESTASETLRFESVSRRFGRVDALQELELACPAGSMTCLIGPNGAGKSTALALAAGLLSPTAGRVRVEGRDAGPPAVAASLGYLPQRSAFHPLLTVGEVVDLVAALRGADAGARRDALELSGLEAVVSRPAGELSGGWLRRLGLSSALLGTPRLLLLDEPFVGLDPQTLDRLLSHIEARLAAGAAVVVASHDFEVLDRLAPRTAVLDEGRLQLVAPAGSGGTRGLYRRGSRGSGAAIAEEARC
jgi:ABC-type multidrug transport system ATPase subunit